ncbi:MAG: hypothetical protein IPM69_02065 [Ignavibacteria bacterium]|nr:hypothetical protein [Ignavibacteria bacterium]
MNGQLLIDSVHYKLSFSKYDSLLYRVVSYDSISFQGQLPLLKERAELYLVVCDSVGSNGHFYISQQLTKFASKESSGDVRDRVRTESSWIGRKIWFEIDSVGNRYSYGAEDSLNADVSPGGAFQPNLFFPFKESNHKLGQSWIVESLDDLPENCIPPPLRKQTSIFRSLPTLDTLGALCNQLQYTLTGQGSVQLRYTNGQMLRTNAVIAQFGKMELNRNYLVPHHLFATAEIKLTMKLPDGKELKGIHNLNSNYFLTEIHTQRPKQEFNANTESLKPSKSKQTNKNNRKK